MRTAFHFPVELFVRGVKQHASYPGLLGREGSSIRLLQNPSWKQE